MTLIEMISGVRSCFSYFSLGSVEVVDEKGEIGLVDGKFLVSGCGSVPASPSPYILSYRQVSE